MGRFSDLLGGKTPAPAPAPTPVKEAAPVKKTEAKKVQSASVPAKVKGSEKE